MLPKLLVLLITYVLIVPKKNIFFGGWIDFDTNMYFNLCNKILTFPGVLLEAQQIIFYKKYTIFNLFKTNNKNKIF